MRYTQKDIFKIATQIESIEVAGDVVNIKLKKSVVLDHFKSSLLSFGVSTALNCKDWKVSVLARNYPELMAFFEKLQKQVERVKLVEKFYRVFLSLSDEEVRYMLDMGMQDAATVIKN